MIKHTKTLSLYARMVILLLMSRPLLAQAAENTLGPFVDSLFAPTQEELLTNEDAFHLLAEYINAHEIQILVQTPPGYFIYKQKFTVTLNSPDYHLGPVSFFGVEQLDDGLTGLVEVLADGDRVLLPILVNDAHASSRPNTLTLNVLLQGCATDRFCYPPTQREITINTPTKANNHAPE